MQIKRNKYLDQIKKFYDSNLIKVITGIRRCGKSVLLNQIKEEITNIYMIDERHLISINFEDTKFSNITNYKKLNKYITDRISDKNKYYIFLDEIQHVNEFEKALASLKATQNVSLFVTGSNSKLLSGRLATLLIGRCKEFKIMPFSFEEALRFYKENHLALPDKPLNNYLRFGGMPQRFDYDNEKDIKDYLKDLFYGIVDKDICNSRSKIDKENFINIAKYIFSNSGKEFLADSIVGFYNKNNSDKIYRETIYRYLEKLEQACLISRVNRYDIATKRNLKSIEKQYVVDNGFFLATNESNQISPAHSLENLVYNELVYRGYDVKIGKTYKGEIDFVAMKDGKKCFIQVAYLLTDENVIKREFGAFDSVRDPSPKYVFSLDDFDLSRDGLSHMNIEDWLLNKKDITIS
jgi:predicted AAA+ superfamily ATPase